MHRSPDFNPPEKASMRTSTDDCFVAEYLKRKLRQRGISFFHPIIALGVSCGED